MRLSVLALILPLLLYTQQVCAEDGVTDNKIVFGQTAAMAGPTAAIGIHVREGIMAAFQEVNDAGGVSGRKLELISLDDGYEPEQAVINTRRLIQDDKVFAIIGNVGSPTANAVLPILTETKVPFIAPFSGAQFLRTPFNRDVINFRASYAQETEALVDYATRVLKATRIAALYQDDAYGLAGLTGVRSALAKRGMSLVGRASYRRNTTAVKEAALRIRDGEPQAVIMVGAYKPCAQFILLAKQLGVQASYLNLSFVGSEALAKELGPNGDGVIISQVVPLPFDDRLPLVAAYQKALHRYDPQAQYGFISLEGYIAGRMAIEILKPLQSNATRETFIDEVYKLGTINLDDLALKFGDNDNQGMKSIFMTRLDSQQKFTPIDQRPAVSP